MSRTPETREFSLKRMFCPFTCKYCELRVSSFDSLRRHIDRHRQKARGTYFTNFSTSSTTHRHRSTDNKSFACRYCKRLFKQRRILKNHVLSHSKWNVHTGQIVGVAAFHHYQCFWCSSEFDDTNEFETHVLLCANQMILSCWICKEQQKDMDSLSEHIKLHTKEKPLFQCEYCQRNCKSKGNLKEHVKIHTNVKDYQCDECGKKFRRKHTLRLHKVNRHSKTRPFKCKQCDKTFADANHLNSHELVHSKVKSHQCEDCLKSFSHRGNLLTHMAKHSSGGKSYDISCNVCFKMFKLNSEFKVHMRLHSGIRSFQCEFCDCHFPDEDSLNGHITKHKEIEKKRYPCDYCGKRFSNRHLLQKHVRTHTKEKPFHCTECDMRFQYRQLLKDHLLVHTGNETPFSCKYCDKRLVSRNKLTYHIKQDHQYELARIPNKKKPYQCGYCQLCYARPKLLLNHKKSKHRGGEI